jgi:UDP-glucose 4-epimerase
MKTILFLGGMGFIGKNLVEAFLQSGEYRCLVFNSGNFIPEPSLLFKQVPIYVGDACAGDVLAKVLTEHPVDILCHLVSTTVPSTSNQNMAFDIESNLKGTVQILDLAVKHGVKKVVYLSSGGTIYGIPRSNPVSEDAPTNPICSHGIVKVAVEKYLHLYQHLYGLEYLVCRVSNPYGEYHHSKIQGIINVVLGKILKGEEIVIWGDGNTVRDYMYVKDTAQIILKLIRAGVSNEIVNIGSGSGTSINEVLHLIRHELGNFPVSYREARSFDVGKIVLDTTKLHSHISHVLMPMPDGLWATIEWTKRRQQSNSAGLFQISNPSVLK